MALVGEIVARFKAETSDYIAKVEGVKAKNKDLAKSMLDTAGSADAAIASLNFAKKRGALGDFGIDPRNVSGIIREIKALDKEMQNAKKSTDDLGKAMSDSAKRAGGFNDIGDAIKRAFSGDVLGAIEKYKKGMADLEETKGMGGGAFKGAIAATAISMIGSELAKVTGKAKDLAQQYREGNISLGEMTDKLAAQLPIYGGIWQAGRNIREMITGENAELQKQLDIQNNISKAIDNANATREKFAKAIKDSQQNTEDKNRETQIKFYRNNGLNDTADMEEAKLKFEQSMRQARSEIESAFDERKKALDEQKKALAKDNQSTAGVDKQIKEIEKERDKAIEARRQAIALELKDEVAFKKAERQKAADKDAKDAADKRKDEIKKQADEAKKAADEIAKRADDFKKASRSNVEAFNDRIDEAAKLLKGKDLDKYLTKDATGLMKEMKGIEPSRVYDSPNVSELRGGQNLFAAPTAISQKQLERLGEIKAELAKIREVAGANGVVIEQLGA